LYVLFFAGFYTFALRIELAVFGVRALTGMG
jgi:hypothetical protein